MIRHVFSRWAAVGAIVTSVWCFAGASLALVKAGQTPAALTVKDVDDKTVSTSVFKGKPLLLVVEDKDGADQNKAFRAKMSELAKNPKITAKLQIAAIADVGKYDYWPAKGLVKDAIRSEAKKLGYPIYADWDEEAQEKLGTKRNTSNIFVFDKTGKTLWASAGKLSDAQMKKLLDVIRWQASI